MMRENSKLMPDAVKAQHHRVKSLLEERKKAWKRHWTTLLA